MRSWIIMVMASAALMEAAGSGAPLSIPAKAGWQQADTGIILMPVLAGLTRTEIADTGTDGLDLVAQYDDGKDDVVATIFLFQPGLASAPIWFDRSRTTIETRDIYRIEAAPPSASFAPPGWAAKAGLRATYASGSTLRSTAVAMAPIGDWLIGIRLSSKSLDAAALDRTLDAVIGQIRWPKQPRDTIAAEAVMDCASKLALTKARVLKADMTEALIGGTLATMAHDPDRKTEEKIPPVRYCRDAVDAAWTIYRADGSDRGYVLALNDAGRAISVQPSLAALLMGGKPRLSVNLLELGHTDTFAPIDRLPPPAQLITMIDGRPSSRVQRGSKDIAIGVGK